jgi:nucleoside-triphosphatase THEP1
VFERILRRIREKVRLREYVVTYHARKEMKEDGFTLYDVERGIFSGDILERQKDRQTSEWKYRVRGETFEDREVEVLAKFSPTGKLVIITVYVP